MFDRRCFNPCENVWSCGSAIQQWEGRCGTRSQNTLYSDPDLDAVKANVTAKFSALALAAQTPVQATITTLDLFLPGGEANFFIPVDYTNPNAGTYIVGGVGSANANLALFNLFKITSTAFVNPPYIATVNLVAYYGNRVAEFNYSLSFSNQTGSGSITGTFTAEIDCNNQIHIINIVGYETGTI